MRKSLVVLALVALSSFTLAQDQKNTFGLKTGLNVSVFSASVNSEATSRAGFHFGAFVKSRLSNSIALRPELYFSSQGQKDDYRLGSGGPSLGKTTTTLNYFNIPLLLEFGNKFSFQSGPQLGFLLSAREKGNYAGTDVDTDLKDIYSKVDFSWVFGVAFAPVDKLSFGARLNLGINDIYNEGEGINLPGFSYPDVKNRVLHFYVAYGF